MKESEHAGRLLILLSLLLIVGFSMTSLISYRVSHQALRNQIINDELPLTSDNIYSGIQRDLLQPVFIASLMANDSFLRNWVIDGEKGTKSLTQFLFETQRKYNTCTSFFVSEHTRRYYQSHGILKTVNKDEKQDSWYFRVRNMKENHEINVDLDEANQFAMTIFVNHKVFDFDGKYIGATGVGLQVKDVKKIIENYHNKFDRIVYFIAPDGKIILSTDNNDGKNIKDIPGLSAVAPQILGAHTTSLEYKMEGKTFYANSRYIPELKWILLVSKSDEHALQNILHSLILNLALCGVVTVIVIILVYFIIKSYRRKLKKMLSIELELKGQNDEQKDEIEKQHQQLVAQNVKLVQLNASKDKLFSIIAHDLRSPIGNMVQLADLAADSLASGESDEAMEYITDQKELSASTLQLLDHLFDWAKSQMSEITCDATDFRLLDCLKECLPRIEIQANKKNIEIDLKCAENIVVNAARNMVMTVVRNLATNAVKFTNDGGKIEISAAVNDNIVTVAIKDSGVGIPPDRIDNLFAFVHNKSTLGTDGEKGTGLGLALCRELINKNGSEIKVGSVLGSGSTFSFTLRKAN